MSRERPAPDQDQRDAAVAARGRNVMIDAGAGTGKTSTIVRRLIGMVAPEGGAAPVPIERIAAITFTRRAAGELRLRIRESILAQLAADTRDPARAEALRAALAGLDTAAIGTIHSFADRLLRRRPVETRLSPEYEIRDDDDLLIAEATDVLLRSAQAGTLATELAGAVDEEVALEAQQTVVDALAAGLRLESQEHEWGVRYGLDGLVEGFLRNRDVRPEPPEPEPFDLERFRAAVAELRDWVEPLVGSAGGILWLKRISAVAADAARWDEPVQVYRRVVAELSRSPRQTTKRDGFAGDDAAWVAWKAFDGDERKKRVRSRPLRDDILDPLRRWLAVRLVRLFPVAVAVYERVKARHRAVDQIDLLLKLRDLLRDDRETRAHFQSLFDHVFVDEFQDTDPLQAEIVLYLCEAGAQAGSWDQVRLAPGKLTIVGDAKQSIYRFRRADVAMYERVRSQIAASHHLACTLSANFRSLPSLIRWLNDRFPDVLGTAPEPGRLFDAASGRVYYQPLLTGRADEAASAPVHVVPYDVPAGAKANAESCRDTEGVALARYLRWIVDNPMVEITDEDTRERRRLIYGDVAILALSTWDLHRLFVQLDREGIPHATRGGTLFLADPLHKRFLLALRAIADRDDGPANAALLRPPFFAIDPLDLLLERDAPEDSTDPRVRRAREARATVAEIRRRRFARPPGETARDLIERTALGGFVARQPNGAQRLRHLREICHVLEQNAVTEGLDYDRATVRLRQWVEKPVQLDPPLPIGTDAVQVLTVHQAKGLEFPVVVLWDGRAGKDSIDPRPAWRIARDGTAWAIGLDGLLCEHPADSGIAKQEKAYRNEERRRLVYVAATRARDILVLPRAPELSHQHIHKWFEEAPEGTVTQAAFYRPESEPEWAQPRETGGGSGAPSLDETIAERWREAIGVAARPQGRPVAVTAAARALAEGGATPESAAFPPAELVARGLVGPGADSYVPDVDDRGVPASPGPPGERHRTGRYGPVFGTTVHRAIALALRFPESLLPSLVRAAAARARLTAHLEEVEADVTRALATLRQLGLVQRDGVELRLEYPIAGTGPDGTLLSGFIDLIAATPEELHVIDFKTDTAPAAAGPARHYGRQLRLYADLLERAEIVGARRVRPALLYTIDGSVHAV